MSAGQVDYNELDFDYSPNGVLCWWQGQPFTGIGVELYPDGSLRAESVFRNGFDTQAGSLWYPAGQIKRRSVAHDAHHMLQVTEWHENGTIKSQTTYEHGIRIAEQSGDAHGLQLTNSQLTEHDEFYSILQLSCTGLKTALQPESVPLLCLASSLPLTKPLPNRSSDTWRLSL